MVGPSVLAGEVVEEVLEDMFEVSVAALDERITGQVLVREINTVGLHGGKNSL